MKILYDHQIFTTQKFGGISRYFYELLNSYSGYPDIQCKLSLLKTGNYYLRDSKFIDRSMFIEGNSNNENFTTTKMIDYLNRFSFPGKTVLKKKIKRMLRPDDIAVANEDYSGTVIRRGDYHIFHPTYYDSYFLKQLGSRPFVLTVYDMIHELFAGRYRDLNNEIIRNKRILIHKAAKVITISENTKKDLLQIYNIPAEKIIVVHLASSFQRISMDSGLHETPEKFLLYVGDRKDYKNFSGLVVAIQKLLLQDNDLYIVCAGGRQFLPSEQELLNKLNISHKVKSVPFINDGVLTHLYSNAIAFVFPSLYEGFGLPILEAFSCGCPVAASNSSSLPEVAGDAAIYFDPLDENSIQNAIVKIMDSKMRQILISKGNKRLKDFTWDKTALQTLEVYREIAG